MTNPVTDPVPVKPHKKEIAPYEGTGELGAVKVGDEITYEISYVNYHLAEADVVIRDTLDPNVEFVSASDGGTETGGIVNWTIRDVPAGEEGKVTLTVKVLEGALKANGGEGKVFNGGDTTTVKIGNDQEYSVEVVENPVEKKAKERDTSPKDSGARTGDESPIALYAIVMMAAASALAVLLNKKRMKE